MNARRHDVEPDPSRATSFTEGSVAQHMIRLSAFMIMGFLTMTIAQLIEAIYLGIVGTEELAAIAFTSPLATRCCGFPTRQGWRQSPVQALC